MPNDSILRDIKTVWDWAVSEQGWDSGAFDRVIAYAEHCTIEEDA